MATNGAIRHMKKCQTCGKVTLTAGHTHMIYSHYDDGKQVSYYCGNYRIIVEESRRNILRFD